MANSSKAMRISEKDWHSHEATLKRLYITQGKPLEKEGGVIEYMKRQHNFSASKSQYGLQFRKWRWRKKLTGVEWREIIQYIQDKNIRFDQVSILLDGTALSEERIRRETLRYGSAQSNEGSASLPKGITIKPIQGPSILHNHTISDSPQTQLQIYQPSRQSPDLSFDVPEWFSPTPVHDNFPQHNIRTQVDGPYFWMDSLELNKLPEAIFSTQQLFPRGHNLAFSQFYSKFSTIETVFSNLCIVDHWRKILAYLIASLLNGSSSPGYPTAIQAYAWLKTIPFSTVARILRSLPERVHDALRERIFISAVEENDATIAEKMLKLGVSPHDAVFKSYNGLKFPLEYAMRMEHDSVAKVIFSEMCHGASQVQINEHFKRYVKLCITHDIFTYGRHSKIKQVETICIALKAGAQPIPRCITMAEGDFDLTKRILETGPNTIEDWLRAGLIKVCLRQSNNRLDRETVITKIFRYIFQDRFDELVAGSPALRMTLIESIKQAVQYKHQWAIESILQAFHRLNFQLADPASPGDIFNDSVIDACHSLDWTRAGLLLLDDFRSRIATEAGKDHRKPEKDYTLLEELLNAVQQDNQDCVCKILEDQIFCRFLNDQDAYPYITSAVEFERRGLRGLADVLNFATDQMAVMIVQILQVSSKHDRGILYLLESGRTAAVSALLKGNPLWNEALMAAKDINDFSLLEDAVYSHLEGPLYIMMCKKSARKIHQQLSLRSLAYHATETDDQALYDWLLESEMDLEEFICEIDTQRKISCLTKRTELGGRSSYKPKPDYHAIKIILPSLLAVAANKDSSLILGLLISSGADCRDSGALSWTVRQKMGFDKIETLLEIAKREVCRHRKAYGSAALREAIRQHDYHLVNILLENKVATDVVETSSHDWIHGIQELSPMGEAIILGNSNMVKLLLQKGANSNALVAYDGFKEQKRKNSVLLRLSPLLAAIEKGNLEIVGSLLEHGAEMEYTRKLGLLRTPLQRASENGNLDIVRYLVDKGAQIDTPPVRSGATALQLAALKGHVDIVAYLISKGANVNYPPAQGDGRTAFEAAAEWGRFDTMSLLMKHYVDLDQEFGDPPRSQYERARSFAEKNGQMASKRFVEDLRKKPLASISEDYLLTWMDFSPS